MSMVTRRRFWSIIPAGIALGRERSKSRILFTSQGKTGVINADGTGQRFLQFDAPRQVTWQPVAFFRDGRRVLLLSMEARRDGPGRPFPDFYHLTPTHIWIYDLDSGALSEIDDKQRLAPFYAPILILPGEQRILFQVVTKGAAQIFSMGLDGTDRKPFTQPGEGFPYGMSISPDGRRIAFHVSGPKPYSYRIFASDLDGGNRTLVAGQPDHLYFGTSWSPDSQWILYHDIHYKTDLGHDWADVCIGKPEGRSEGPVHRVLTEGSPHWASATYGNSKSFGNGSNMPQWMPDGSILFSRKIPGSRTAWEFDPTLPNDHFQRAFKPELARGGTELCLLNPQTGLMKPVTHADPPHWDFRAMPSPNGSQIVFCRANVGEQPAIWVADRDGRNQLLLTRGFEDRGADQPKWLAVDAIL